MVVWRLVRVAGAYVGAGEVFDIGRWPSGVFEGLNHDIDSAGKRQRYRLNSAAATKAAALNEEARRRDRAARFGTPFFEDESVANGQRLVSGEVAAEPSFGAVMTEYEQLYFPSELKVTTQAGYRSVMRLLQRYSDWPLSRAATEASRDIDAHLAKKKTRRGKPYSKSARNNVQIAFRSVLSFARERGLLKSEPVVIGLRQPGKTIFDIPTKDEVEAIINEARCAHHRRSLGLVAYSGLRPHEVRGLRRRRVNLAGGLITVAMGMSFGVEHEPKTGPRVIPIVPPLALLLEPVADWPRDGFVALNIYGKPWGQDGMSQLFRRVADRLGYTEWTLYVLRHFAITSWLRGGIAPHVVKRLAGHVQLSTTEHYIHYLGDDLNEAARKMGSIWAAAR